MITNLLHLVVFPVVGPVEVPLIRLPSSPPRPERQSLQRLHLLLGALSLGGGQRTRDWCPDRVGLDNVVRNDPGGKMATPLTPSLFLPVCLSSSYRS